MSVGQKPATARKTLDLSKQAEKKKRRFKQHTIILRDVKRL